MSTGVLALCLRASRSPPALVTCLAEKHSPEGQHDRGAARVEALRGRPSASARRAVIEFGLGWGSRSAHGRLGSLFTDPETLVKQRRRMGNSQPNGPKYRLVRPNRKPTSTPPAVPTAVPPAVPTAVPPPLPPPFPPPLPPPLPPPDPPPPDPPPADPPPPPLDPPPEPPLDPPPEPPLPEPPPPDPALVLPALATPPVGPPPLGPPLVLRNAVEFLGASPKSAKRIGGKLGAARLFACRLA